MQEDLELQENNQDEELNLPKIELEIKDKFGNDQTGISLFKIVNVSFEGNLIGKVDIQVNTKREEMWVTGVDFSDNTNKGYGTATYINLAKLLPEYKLVSSGDYFVQPDGQRLGVKLWEKLERLGYARRIEDEAWEMLRSEE